MDLKIEEKLSKFKSRIIDYATLKSILESLGYSDIKLKIYKLKQKGIIKSLKKGIYVHMPVLSNNIVSKELISNNLLGNPSYISLDYALYYHGLIPETVHEVTAVTTKRSKVFKTDFGIFSYKQIKEELYALGVNIESSKEGNFLIASKEKALCDKVYFIKNIKITSKQKMYEFLENDLRIDTDELKDFNVEIILRYYEISKSKKIKLLLNFIKEL
jgi:predicted transcriptional regulator of viral defense system